jgi:hypothetical protein
MLECSAFLPRAMDSAEPVVEAPRDSGCRGASECWARQEEGKPADAVPAESAERAALRVAQQEAAETAAAVWPEADSPEAEPVEVAGRRAAS